MRNSSIITTFKPHPSVVCVYLQLTHHPLINRQLAKLRVSRKWSVSMAGQDAPLPLLAYVFLLSFLCVAWETSGGKPSSAGGNLPSLAAMASDELRKHCTFSTRGVVPDGFYLQLCTLETSGCIVWVKALIKTLASLDKGNKTKQKNLQD